MQRNSIHPGFILLHEVMQPFDISQNALARGLGVSPRRINEIVHGKRAITADTAIGLEEAIGIPALSWLKWQAEYDIEVARARRSKGPPRKCSPIVGLDHSPNDDAVLDEASAEGRGVKTGYDGRRHGESWDEWLTRQVP